MYEGAITNILSDLYGPAAAQPSPMPDLLRGQQPRQMGPTAMPPQAQMPPPGPPPQAQMPPPQPPAQPPQAALPKALGTGDPGFWNARNAELQQRRTAAEAELQAAMQPTDRSAMEAIYNKRAATGSGHLLKALAAIEAGKEFAPVSQHFLRASEEAVAPMKMTGGTMTEQGFIEDPGHASEMRIKRAEAAIAQIDKVEQFNITREEAARMAREREQWQKEMQDARLANAVAIKSMGHAIAGALGGSNAGTWSQIGTDPVTKMPVMQNNKTLQLATHDKTGKPIPYSGDIGPKGGVKEPSEDERKSATLLQRLEFSEKQLEDIIKENPKAATPSTAGKMAANVPIVGDWASTLITPDAKQRVENAQLDILDAALTLGTGAAYTREQLKGYAKSYFVQPGETDPKVIADKKARLKNVIDAAKTRAGRALPKSGSMLPEASWDQTATAAPGVTEGATATGPNGQKIRFSNGQWVPVQ